MAAGSILYGKAECTRPPREWRQSQCTVGKLEQATGRESSPVREQRLRQRLEQRFRERIRIVENLAVAGEVRRQLFQMSTHCGALYTSRAREWSLLTASDAIAAPNEKQAELDGRAGRSIPRRK